MPFRQFGDGLRRRLGVHCRSRLHFKPRRRQSLDGSCNPASSTSNHFSRDVKPSVAQSSCLASCYIRLASARIRQQSAQTCTATLTRRDRCSKDGGRETRLRVWRTVRSSSRSRIRYAMLIMLTESVPRSALLVSLSSATRSPSSATT